MKLYNSMGPNPRIVRMFMAEKGITLDMEEIDLMAGDNRREPFLSKNPAGQLPALELDSGTVIAEVTAICEYLEELNPEPALVGTTAEERAVSRMWTRRIDLKICEPLGMGFRSGAGHALFKDRMRLYPESADNMIAGGNEGLEWLDAQIAGRDYIAGDQCTLVDILLYCWLDFAKTMGLPIAEPANVAAWMQRMGDRDSAKASA
jgi:glutathione S-transferase